MPVVHASVFRFEGQLTVFVPFEGPCYRCLYPTPPPPELAPGCSVAGVLGVVPGVMGLLQATEAVKLILGIGDPLVGRLLIWDALDGTFTELELSATRTARCAWMLHAGGHGAGGRGVRADRTLMTAVRLPPVLRQYAGDAKQVEASGANWLK
jgi:hypothetical protein